MIYLAIFALSFSIIQLLVAISNLLFAQELKKTNTNYNALVSVLIPARNEEENIGSLLSDLQKQDYQNIEIIVFNDQSTDKTESIIKQFTDNDKRIMQLKSDHLPNGWLGKNYACNRLSAHAKGSFLLFLDADVRIKNGIIKCTTDMVKKHNLGLLSIFPTQQMKSIGEKITVPNMNFILLSLLPLILVQKSKYSSLAAANGQFMLFDADTYHKTNPHEKHKNNKVEDIEIARYLKKQKYTIACLTGNNSINCRMYKGFSQAVDGFSKNVINFFGNSFSVAFLFWLTTTFGFVPIFISLGYSTVATYLIIILITRFIISNISKQNAKWNLLYIIPQQFTLGLIVFKAFYIKLKKQHLWKGRNIY